MSDIERSPEDAPDVMLGTWTNELPDWDDEDDILDTDERRTA
jgi:hypothetical protein